MSLDIELADGNKFYVTGQIVSGKVKFTTGEPKQVKKVDLHFIGFEMVENSILSDIPFQKRWIVCGKSTLASINSSDPSASSTLPAGTHEWIFSFQIPKNIPPSTTHKNGRVLIEYSIKVAISLEATVAPLICSVPLRVSSQYQIDLSKPVSSVRVSRGRISVETTMKKPVVCPGDPVELQVKLLNNTATTIHHLKVKIKREIRYGLGNFDKQTIFKMKKADSNFPICQRNHDCTIDIVVPAHSTMETPTVETALLAKIRYYVSVRAFLIGKRDIITRIPLVLSHVPAKIVNSPPSKKKKKKIAPTIEIENAVEKNALLDFDWVSPVPGQFSTPQDSSFTDVVASSITKLDESLQKLQKRDTFQSSTESIPSYPLCAEYLIQRGKAIVKMAESVNGEFSSSSLVIAQICEQVAEFCNAVVSTSGRILSEEYRNHLLELSKQIPNLLKDLFTTTSSKSEITSSVITEEMDHVISQVEDHLVTYTKAIAQVLLALLNCKNKFDHVVQNPNCNQEFDLKIFEKEIDSFTFNFSSLMKTLSVDFLQLENKLKIVEVVLLSAIQIVKMSWSRSEKKEDVEKEVEKFALSISDFVNYCVTCMQHGGSKLDAVSVVESIETPIHHSLTFLKKVILELPTLPNVQTLEPAKPIVKELDLGKLDKQISVKELAEAVRKMKAEDKVIAELKRKQRKQEATFDFENVQPIPASLLHSSPISPLTTEISSVSAPSKMQSVSLSSALELLANAGLEVSKKTMELVSASKNVNRDFN